MKQYIVDAFVAEEYLGNPAAVCVLEEDISDEEMQKKAYDNNLSETAFVRNMGDSYKLRWFTPGCEVSLCGHATLATTAVLSTFYEADKAEFVYETKSGRIVVVKKDDWFQLDLPAQTIGAFRLNDAVRRAVGIEPVEVFQTCDVVCVLEKEADVINFEPNFEAIKAIEEGEGLIITAPSERYDFVSRCFYPKEAINEDPVTGSAHCSLMPYWSKRLGKKELIAYQASERGGILRCEDAGDRIFVSGKAHIRE